MYHDFLILGGAGLVGLQVCRHLVGKMQPRRIVVGSLLEREAVAACQALEDEFGDRVAFVPAWGNLFVPSDFANASRNDLMADRAARGRLLRSLYDDFEAAYRDNHLVRLIRQHRPEVIVDCVNTATGLSYQNVFDGAHKVMESLSETGFDSEAGTTDLAGLLAAQQDGVLLARAAARTTSDAANQMMAKKGWAQWFWGVRWERKDGGWKIPTIANTITIVVADERKQTVSVHLWGKEMVTSVRKASAVYDVSGVKGAFDPSATLTVADVAAGVKAGEASLPIAVDPATSHILGKKKK